MKLSEYRTDETKISEGVVKKFDADGKVYIRVARHNNPKFQAGMRRRLDQYKSFRKNAIPDDVIDRETRKELARSVLLEMVGFEDDFGDITGTKGAVIPDTVENREKVLLNKSYDSFLDMVSNVSMDFDSFKVEAEQEDEGNSSSGSSGSGDGDEKKSS